MIESVKKYQVQLGNGSVLHRLIYESPECPFGKEKSLLCIVNLLQTFATSPGLLNPNNLNFETIKIHHNGSNWVVEAQATQKVEPDIIF